MLDKVGDGLFIRGYTDCTQLLFGSYWLYGEVRGCNAVAMTLKGGNPDVSELRFVYTFSSERRAELEADNIEESFLDSDEDIDIDFLEADGELVTIDITIHHEP